MVATHFLLLVLLFRQELLNKLPQTASLGTLFRDLNQSNLIADDKLSVAEPTEKYTSRKQMNAVEFVKMFGILVAIVSGIIGSTLGIIQIGIFLGLWPELLI